MVMLYLCFSKYCIILGLVTKLRWQLQCLQRNAESKNTTNKCVHGQVGSSSVYREMQSQRIQQTSGYMDFILL